ncbi:MAG TPA: PKD domain-containing protein [Vulgatibacter sp.]|nr:PKD domain-containing protein [Vulgatibacter sp.]
MKRLTMIAALLALVAACGGDEEGAPAAPPLPVARLAGPTVAELGDLLTFDASASSGPFALEYDWRFESPEGLVQRPVRNGERMATLRADQVGTWRVTLEIRDERGREASDALSVRMRSVPVAEPGKDRLVKVGETVSLDGSASHDPGGAALSYSWEIRIAPEVVDIVDADAAIATFVPKSPGEYVFALTVSNGERSATSRDLTILAQ